MGGMSSYSEVLKELTKCQRERQIVKTALISEELRAKMLAEIDAKVASLSLKTDPAPKSGKGGA